MRPGVVGLARNSQIPHSKASLVPPIPHPILAGALLVLLARVDPSPGALDHIHP